MKMAERLRLSAPPMMQFADSLRLCALLGHATHENCGTSQAVCMPLMKFPTVSGYVHPRSRKWWGVSGGLHAHDENCRESQALCAFCERHSRKLRGVSGSVHPHRKIADSLRLCAPARTKMVGRLRRLACPESKLPTVSGSVHPPMRKLPTASGSEDFLRFPRTKIAGRRRLFAPP